MEHFDNGCEKCENILAFAIHAIIFMYKAASLAGSGACLDMREPRGLLCKEQRHLKILDYKISAHNFACLLVL